MKAADDDWDAILAAELEKVEEADDDDELEQAIEATRLRLQESSDNTQPIDSWTTFLQSAKQHEAQLGELLPLSPHSASVAEEVAAIAQDVPIGLGLGDGMVEEVRHTVELTDADIGELRDVVEGIVVAACTVYYVSESDLRVGSTQQQPELALKSDAEQTPLWVGSNESEGARGAFSLPDFAVEQAVESTILEVDDRHVVAPDAVLSQETGRLDTVLQHAEQEFEQALQRKRGEHERRRQRRLEEIELAKRKAAEEAAAEATRAAKELQLMCQADFETRAREAVEIELLARARLEAEIMAQEDVDAPMIEVASGEEGVDETEEAQAEEQEKAELEQAEIAAEAAEGGAEGEQERETEQAATVDRAVPEAVSEPVAITKKHQAAGRVMSGWGGAVERLPLRTVEALPGQDTAAVPEPSEVEVRKASGASDSQAEATANARFVEIKELCERYWKRFAEQAQESEQKRTDPECQKFAAWLRESKPRKKATTNNNFNIEQASFDVWRRWLEPTVHGRHENARSVQAAAVEVEHGESNSDEQLPAATQQGLSLRTLQIAEICVEDLQDLSVFRDCVSLRKLQLEVNQLTSLQSVERLWKIEELSVRDNSLVDISGLSTLTALRELHLDVNKIASLDALENLPNLHFVTATVNRLEKLPQLKSPLLHRLELYHNRIQSTPSNALGRLESLTHLDLAKNQLAYISGETLSACPSLTHLVLSQNRLSALPAPLYLPLLRVLWLSGNQLTDCNVWLPGRGVFGDNQPRALMNVFLPSLEDLYLQGNQLHDIPPEIFRSMRGLQKLDISFNNIESLGFVAGLRDFVRRLTWLHASDNPVAAASDVVPRMLAASPWLTECNGVQITSQFVEQAWDVLVEEWKQQPPPPATSRAFHKLLEKARGPEGWTAIRRSVAALADVVFAGTSSPPAFCQEMLPVLYIMADEQRDLRAQYKRGRSASWLQLAANQQEFSHEWHALITRQVYRIVNWEEYCLDTIRMIPTSTSPAQASAPPAAQQAQVAVASLQMLMSLVEEEEEEQQKATQEAARAVDLQHAENETALLDSTHPQQELHTAAAKVQSVFRGYHVRRSLKAALESAKYIDTELDDMLNFGVDEVFDFCAPELDDNWMMSAVHTGVGVHGPFSPGDGSVDGEEDVDLAAPVVFGDHKRPHHPPSHHRASETAEEKATVVIEEALSVASGSEFSEPLSSKKVHRSLHKEALMAEWGFTNPDVASAMMKRARRLNHFQRAAKRRQEQQKKHRYHIRSSQRSGSVFEHTPEAARPPVDPLRRIASSRSDDTDLRRAQQPSHPSVAAAYSTSRPARLPIPLPKQSLGVEDS